MILVNNTLVQGQHDFYKRVGITLQEEDNNENPILDSGNEPEPGNEDPEGGEK